MPQLKKKKPFLKKVPALPASEDEEEESQSLLPESLPIPRKDPPRGQHYDSTTEEEEDEAQSPATASKKPAKTKPASTPAAPASDPEETQDPSSQASRHSSDDGQTQGTNKIRLTESVMEDLAAWLRDNPCIYDKTHKDYAQKGKRDRLFEERAKALDPPLTGNQLRTWYQSTRTAVGRHDMKLPSGSAAVLNMSHRKRFLKRTFGFLQKYMKDTSRRQPGTSLQQKIKARSQQSQGSSAGSMPEEEEDDDDMPPEMPDLDTSFNTSTPVPGPSPRPSSSQRSRPPSAPATATKKRKKTQSPPESGQTEDLAARMDEIQKLQQVVYSKMTATSQQLQARREFVNSIVDQLRDVDEQLWTEFMEGTFALAMDIRKKHYGRRQVLHQPAPLFPAPPPPPMTPAPRHVLIPVPRPEVQAQVERAKLIQQLREQQLRDQQTLLHRLRLHPSSQQQQHQPSSSSSLGSWHWHSPSKSTASSSLMPPPSTAGSSASLQLPSGLYESTLASEDSLPSQPTQYFEESQELKSLREQNPNIHELLEQSPRKRLASSSSAAASRCVWDSIPSPGLGRPVARPVYADFNEFVDSPSLSFLDSNSPYYRMHSPAQRPPPSPIDVPQLRVPVIQSSASETAAAAAAAKSSSSEVPPATSTEDSLHTPGPSTPATPAATTSS